MGANGRSAPAVEPWRRRLYLPAYRVSAAARYAELTRQTVTRWHRGTEAGAAGMPERQPRAALSYLQLIEVAVVAAFRRKNVSLKAIRTARDYAAQQFECEFPFAQLEFARAGRELLLTLQDVLSGDETGAVVASKWGQWAWEEFLPEFEYEDGDIVTRWHPRGKESPILIDPRIAFGAPAVEGVPTWAIKGRTEAGETIEEIVDDFSLQRADVLAALTFEGVAA